MMIHSLCLPLSPPTVSTAAGLLCLFLVSLLHAGGVAGTRGPQEPPLPAQEMGGSAGQEGAWRQRSGGGASTAGAQGRREAGLWPGVALGLELESKRNV